MIRKYKAVQMGGSYAWKYGTILNFRRSTYYLSSTDYPGILTPVYKETICESIGFTDNNNNEVYRGDYLKNGSMTIVVDWDKDRLGYLFYPVISDTGEISKDGLSITLSCLRSMLGGIVLTGDNIYDKYSYKEMEDINE